MIRTIRIQYGATIVTIPAATVVAAATKGDCILVYQSVNHGGDRKSVV